jgi:hypothetical protein
VRAYETPLRIDLNPLLGHVIARDALNTFDTPAIALIDRVGLGERWLRKHACLHPDDNYFAAVGLI